MYKMIMRFKKVIFLTVFFLSNIAFAEALNCKGLLALEESNTPLEALEDYIKSRNWWSIGTLKDAQRREQVLGLLPKASHPEARLERFDESFDFDPKKGAGWPIPVLKLFDFYTELLTHFRVFVDQPQLSEDGSYKNLVVKYDANFSVDIRNMLISTPGSNGVVLPDHLSFLDPFISEILALELRRDFDWFSHRFIYLSFSISDPGGGEESLDLAGYEGGVYRSEDVNYVLELVKDPFSGLFGDSTGLGFVETSDFRGSNIQPSEIEGSKLSEVANSFGVHSLSKDIVYRLGPRVITKAKAIAANMRRISIKVTFSDELVFSPGDSINANYRTVSGNKVRFTPLGIYNREAFVKSLESEETD